MNGLQPRNYGNKQLIINYDELPEPELEDLLPEIEKLM